MSGVRRWRAGSTTRVVVGLALASLIILALAAVVLSG
jgi:hypothetical protein